MCGFEERCADRAEYDRAEYERVRCDECDPAWCPEYDRVEYDRERWEEYDREACEECKPPREPLLFATADIEKSKTNSRTLRRMLCSATERGLREYCASAEHGAQEPK